MSHTQPVAAHTPDNDDIDLGRLFGLLLDNKWLIVGITAAFAISGTLYAFFATPIYRADALVQIEQISPSNPLADVTSLLGQEPPSLAEMEIIKSRMVLGSAVDILNLDLVVEPVRFPIIGNFLVRKGVERPAFANNWASTWAGETLTLAAMPVVDDYLGEAFRLQVLGDRHYALYLDGEKLGEGRVDEPTEFLNGDVSLTVGAIRAAPGAEFEIQQVRRRLAIAELRENLSVTEQGKETGILSWGFTSPDPALAERVLGTIADIYVAQNIQRQSEEARKSLEFLQDQVPLVRAQLTDAEELLNTYRTGQESVDLSLETQSVLERLVNIESKLNELSFAEAEISRRFTPSHPTYSALLDKKDQLQKEKASIESKINALPQTQQEILRLQRDVAVTQEIYVQLRNKVQEMQIAEASTVGNVRVLDTAEVFPEPVKPNKLFIVVVATLLGGMVAVGLVLLRAAFRRGVETPDQLEALGLPVYATVPLSEEQRKFSRPGRRRGEKGRLIPLDLLARRNPADTSIEALRGLRTSLYFGMMEAGNNSIMITGPSPGIGKSFISVNLGAVCAQMGQRVLVIDGDMRRGHIHTLFQARNSAGLSTLLSGRASVEEITRTVPGVDGLHYISRGEAPPNPAELLGTDAFKTLMETASKDYDLVIIDSPPILAVTDAAIIGKRVGATLLVARFQLNPPKEVELAVKRLETAGVKVTGAILNALQRTAAGAYGYGYYNYSYDQTAP